MIGTTANFSTANYSVVAMLAVPIPTDARVGDRYRIDIVRPSGTSDGGERSVNLTPDTAREYHQRLIRDVSHELRSPLARLNVALELARQSAGSGHTAPWWKRIVNSKLKINHWPSASMRPGRHRRN